MASTLLVQGKNGVSYRLIVCFGYDEKGKKLMRTKNWRPNQEEQKLPLPTLKMMADEKAKEFQTALRAGREYILGYRITFPDFADKFIEHKIKMNLKESTIQSMRISFGKGKEFFETYKLSEITVYALEEFFLSLSPGLKHSTISKVKKHFNMLFKYAVKYKALNESPMENLELPRTDNSLYNANLKKKFYSPQEADQLLDWLMLDLNQTTLNEQERLLVITGLLTGARQGEIMGLTWDCVDFINSTLTISKQQTRKGLLDRELKTKKSRRIIPLPNDLAKLLFEYKAHLSGAFEETGQIFSYSNCTAYTRFKDAIKLHNEQAQNKLPDIPFHGLRHTCTVYLIHNKVDVATIAELLGHSSLRTTLEIYSHAFEESKVEAMSVFNTRSSALL